MGDSSRRHFWEVQRHSFADVMHSLENCAGYWGLVSGTSPRDYQPWHSSLIIIRCSFFTWAPTIQPWKVWGVSEGSQSPGSSDEGLWSAGMFFVSPAGQWAGVWKGQSNLANQQVVTGLVPQPRVPLLRPWELFEKTGLLGADGVHLTEKWKSIFHYRLAKLVKRS